MIPKKKVLLGLLIVILAGLIFELSREYSVYQNDRQRLNTAFQQLKYNMTREEVTQIMGRPDHLGLRLANDSVEVWYWKATEDPGFLLRSFVLTHQTLPLVVTAWFQGKDMIHVEINGN